MSLQLPHLTFRSAHVALPLRIHFAFAVVHLSKMRQRFRNGREPRLGLAKHALVHRSAFEDVLEEHLA